MQGSIQSLRPSSESLMQSPTSAPASKLSWRRRLLRHLRNALLTCAVLLGPNLVFYVQWGWPNEPIPAVSTQQDESSPSASINAELADALRDALHEHRQRTGLPSLSAAVGRDDGLLWAGATGWADIEKAIPARVNSRYRTGSLAKPITATALMRLQEAGRVDLDAPISTYVSDLPAALRPLTARLLASHQAGVRHYSLIPAWWWGWHEAFSTQHYASVADGLAIFAEDDLVFAPGTAFRYTTFGYSLLARLMEGAAGKPIDAVLTEHVLGPVGMRDTAVDGLAPMPRRVAFYQADGGRYTASYPIDSSNKIAGGGLVSTPSDLVLLGQALLGDELLSAAGKQALFTPLALADGSMNPQNYALGWRIDTSVRLLGEDRPTRIIHHGGAQAGAAAFLMLLPEHGISVAVMSNSGTGTARAEAQEAAYVLARRIIDR